VLALQHIQKRAAASASPRDGSVSPTPAGGPKDDARAKAEDLPIEDQEAHEPEGYTFTGRKAIRSDR